MPEVSLSEEASRSEVSCRKALDGDKDSERKNRGPMGLNSMVIFLLGLLFHPSQNQGRNNCGE